MKKMTVFVLFLLPASLSGDEVFARMVAVISVEAERSHQRVVPGKSRNLKPESQRKKS